jgi:hypothetical protein
MWFRLRPDEHVKHTRLHYGDKSIPRIRRRNTLLGALYATTDFASSAKTPPVTAKTERCTLVQIVCIDPAHRIKRDAVNAEWS